MPEDADSVWVVRGTNGRTCYHEDPECYYLDGGRNVHETTVDAIDTHLEPCSRCCEGKMSNGDFEDVATDGGRTICDRCQQPTESGRTDERGEPICEDCPPLAADGGGIVLENETVACGPCGKLFDCQDDFLNHNCRPYEGVELSALEVVMRTGGFAG